jgi:2-iminobutanoate/2-iminopropanoate deaminase
MSRMRTLLLPLLLVFAATALPAQRKTINLQPNANRPFSDAVLVGDTLYLAGAMGRDADGSFPAAFADEARAALQHQGLVLKAAGLGFADVVKVTCFIGDLKDYDEWNKVYREFFKGPDLPARSTVQVAGLVAKGRIEVEMIAVNTKASLKQEPNPIVNISIHPSTRGACPSATPSW